MKYLTKLFNELFEQVQNLEEQTIIKVSAGHHSAALNRRGELFVWGTGLFGEFMFPTKFSKIDSPFNDLAVGGFFGAAVDANGVVWTWGSNQHGELGVGDFQPRLNPFPVAALKARKVIKVACGTNYMVALSAPKIKDPSNQQEQKTQKNKHQSSIHQTSVGMGVDDDNNRRKETLGHHVESTMTDVSVSKTNQGNQPIKKNVMEQRMKRQNMSFDNYNSRNYLNAEANNSDKNEYFDNSRDIGISPLPPSHNSSQIGSSYNTLNHSQLPPSNNNHQRSHNEQQQYTTFESSTMAQKRSLSPISQQQQEVKRLHRNDSKGQLGDIPSGEHPHMSSYNDNYKSHQSQSHYLSSQYSTINPPPSKPIYDNKHHRDNSFSIYPRTSTSQASLNHSNNTSHHLEANLKYHMPPISKSPSLTGPESFLNYDSSKRVSTENIGARKGSQSETYYNQNKVRQLEQQRNAQLNGEKQMSDIEHNILMSKYNYLEETLNNERKEKTSLESNLFELRSQLKEIQYGKGGLNDLIILLNEEIQKFEQLKRNHEELQRRNSENESRITDLSKELELVNSIKEDQHKSIQFSKEDIKQKNHQLQLFTSQISKLEAVFAEKQILVDNLQFTKEEIKEKDHQLQIYQSQIQQLQSVFADKQELGEKLLNAKDEIKEKNQQLQICTSQVQKLIISEKQELVNKVQDNLEKQVDKYKTEQKRTSEIVTQLNQQCQDFKENYSFLENRLASYQENFSNLQQELKEKEDENISEIQQKQKFEQYYYAQLKTNEEITLENKSFKEQLQSCRMKLQASQDNEQRLQNQLQDLQEENKSLQEQIPKIEDLHREVRNKDEYIDEVESKCNALKATVKELEEKNIKLGELLNAEVDRQAEQYKQKTLKNLYQNAEQLYELFNQNDNGLNNISNKNIKQQQQQQQQQQQYQEEDENEDEFEHNHMIHNQTFDSVDNPTIKHSSLTSSAYIHNKPARVLQNNAQDSLAQSTNRHILVTPIDSPSRMQHNLQNSSFTQNNRSDIVRSKLKTKIEDQKRKISSSAKKLLDILDNSQDNTNNSNLYSSNLGYSQVNSEMHNKQGEELNNLQKHFDEEQDQQPFKKNSLTPIKYPQTNKEQTQKNQQKQQENSSNNNYSPNLQNNVSLTYSPARSKIKVNLEGRQAVEPSLPYQQNIQNQHIKDRNKQDKNDEEHNQKMKDLTDVKERLAYMKRTKDQLESKIHDMDSRLNKYQDYGKK